MKDKVLVVVDEPTLLETLEYNLTRQGYEVYTAADGLTALEIARRERPDAIVLDIMLPGLDGFVPRSAMGNERAHPDAHCLGRRGGQGGRAGGVPPVTGWSPPRGCCVTWRRWKRQ
jgi:PleD family two-component response regulator